MNIIITNLTPFIGFNSLFLSYLTRSVIDMMNENDPIIELYFRSTNWKQNGFTFYQRFKFTITSAWFVNLLISLVFVWTVKATK